MHPNFWAGTLHQNAPRDHYVGTVKNQAIQLAIVQTRASATPVVRLDTSLETAQLPQFPPGTWGCAITATSKAILLLTAQMTRLATTVGKQVTWHAIVAMILYATSAMFLGMWLDSVPRLTFWETGVVGLAVVGSETLYVGTASSWVIWAGIARPPWWSVATVEVEVTWHLSVLLGGLWTAFPGGTDINCMAGSSYMTDSAPPLRRDCSSRFQIRFRLKHDTYLRCWNSELYVVWMLWFWHCAFPSA